MWRTIIVLLSGLALAGLAACAPLRVGEPPTLQTACVQKFQALDTRLAREDLHDAGAYRVPGFPYLRLTRFMGSFAHELDNPGKRRVWLNALRQEDQRARRHELRNLGVHDPHEQAQQLQACGRLLVDGLLADRERFDALLRRASVPDDYSMMARVFGAYPLAVPFLRQGIAGYHDRVRRMYANPLRGPARLYKPAGARPAAVWPADAERDALGRPRLSEVQRQQLLRRHAPAWWVEQAGVDDRPGQPVWRQGVPVVAIDKPVTYGMLTHTRFEGHVLVQLVYTLWFPARTAESSLDPYAGRFDGVVWRVTLDTDGKPLLYDSIHACGCYHYFFAARPVRRLPQDDFWQEPVLYPQSDLPAEPLVLRLQAGTHYLKRVLPHSAADAQPVRYQLLPYGTLRSLSDGQGGHRSLFAADGLLPGSERLERFWLWPSGVPSPGTMRQWGNHATAFVGRRHFDDPRLLERLISRLPPQ